MWGLPLHSRWWHQTKEVTNTSGEVCEQWQVQLCANPPHFLPQSANDLPNNPWGAISGSHLETELRWHWKLEDSQIHHWSPQVTNFMNEKLDELSNMSPYSAILLKLFQFHAEIEKRQWAASRQQTEETKKSSAQTSKPTTTLTDKAKGAIYGAPSFTKKVSPQTTTSTTTIANKTQTTKKLDAAITTKAAINIRNRGNIWTNGSHFTAPSSSLQHTRIQQHLQCWLHLGSVTPCSSTISSIDWVS